MNEDGGRHLPALGVLPTHERFEADHQMVFGPHHRLVMQLQLVSRERLALVIEQQATLFLLVLEVGGVEAKLAPTAVLGGVKRQVRGARELVSL